MIVKSGMEGDAENTKDIIKIIQSPAITGWT
jgi:hypothetical protein